VGVGETRKSSPKISKLWGRGWKFVGWARAAWKRAEVVVWIWERREVCWWGGRGRVDRRWMLLLLGVVGGVGKVVEFAVLFGVVEMVAVESM